MSAKQGKGAEVAATESERIPFRFHPRVFAALGADLVTNDVVAVIELVKNCYDAGAGIVEIRFSEKGDSRNLEILDDGGGMTHDVIQNAWCVVATPFRLQHPVSAVGSTKRRVSGEKGLGRLSAARLGSRLHMLTRSANQPCWEVNVNWLEIASQSELDQCSAEVKERNASECPFDPTGTSVKIFGLHAEWNHEQIQDLRENLARLLAPFAGISKFEIRLKTSVENVDSVKIEAPQFLSMPPYQITGTVGASGNITARYQFRPVAVPIKDAKAKPSADESKKPQRSAEVKRYWNDIRSQKDFPAILKQREVPGCGPFSFEVRAWDLGGQDTEKMSAAFDLAKSSIRRSIAAHKGISVYRDSILVLPKSEDARDWMGLDLRRVSRVGTRLSTSQIVGYVAIKADENRTLADSSNREGFVETPDTLAFQELLNEVVRALEIERDADRFSPREEIQIDQLFASMSADELVEEVRTLAEDGAVTNDVVVKVENFNRQLVNAREAIRQRFVYYSRLATIGSIAQTLVHEIRNRTTGIARFLRNCGKLSRETFSTEMTSQLELAQSSVMALEQLADTFAPLATRTFSRKRSAELETSAGRCAALAAPATTSAVVEFAIPQRPLHVVAVDPGELEAILLNLFLNAAFWVTKSDRAPIVSMTTKKSTNPNRIAIQIDDSGPGVPDEDMERVFLPGITRRAGGMGMGLTLAAELVTQYGGTLHLVQPSNLGGASFRFDLPLKGA